jgi:hypothetical protein
MHIYPSYPEYTPYIPLHSKLVDALHSAATYKKFTMLAARSLYNVCAPMYTCSVTSVTVNVGVGSRIA